MAADQATGRALHGLDQLELEPVTESGRAGQLAARAWAALWPKLLAIALVIAVWQLVYLSHWKPPELLASPATVFSTLGHQAMHAQLWSIIGVTMRTAVIGYAAALGIGVVVGLLVARIAPLRAAVGSIITGLQTMPSIAWVPFAIILFGPESSAIYFVVILGAAPSIASGLITGVDYTPPLLLRAGRTMGLRGVTLYRYLILPASLPSFVAGMKQGWAFAWRSLMAGELVVQVLGQFSIGQQLSVDQQNLDFAGATSVIIVILIIGIVVDTLFTKADMSLRRRRGLLDPSVA